MRTTTILNLLVIGVALAGVSSCVGDDLNESELEQGIAAPPSNLTATVISSTQINLNWNAGAGAVRYYVYKGTAPGNEGFYATTPNLSYPIGALTPGTTYCFVVTSGDADGIQSGPSNEVCATTQGTPAPPTGVTATAVSTSAIQVSWNAVMGAQSYYVYQSAAGNPYTFLATTTATSTNAKSLSANTNYCYVVAVRTAAGTSVGSAPACTNTFAAGLEARWKLNDRTGTTAVDSSGFGHNGTLQGGVAFSTTDVAPLGGNSSALSSSGAADAFVTIPSAGQFNLGGDFTVALWVKLSAAPSGDVFLLGKRAASCGATTWQLVQTPTGLRFDGSANQSFNQSLAVGAWTHVAISKTGSATVLYLNGTAVRTVGYAPGTASTSPVQLGNSGGCGSSTGFTLDEVRIYSSGLTAQEISDLGSVPPAPTNLSATVMSSTRIDLSWDAVSTTNLEGYFVYRGTAPGNETFFATVPVGTTTYSVTHLDPETDYYFTVRDQAHGVLSTMSTEVLATTQPLPPPPANVTATPISATQVNVSWDAVTGATAYYVYQSVAGAPYTFLATVLPPSTMSPVGNLTSGTEYCYVVTVSTSNGTSAGSAPVCATTP